jgi:putative SOS response-associated peptidase YedK
VDGFFEYHWFKNKAYPFYVRMKNENPMLLGGFMGDLALQTGRNGETYLQHCDDKSESVDGIHS